MSDWISKIDVAFFLNRITAYLTSSKCWLIILQMVHSYHAVTKANYSVYLLTSDQVSNPMNTYVIYHGSEILCLCSNWCFIVYLYCTVNSTIYTSKRSCPLLVLCACITHYAFSIILINNSTFVSFSCKIYTSSVRSTFFECTNACAHYALHALLLRTNFACGFCVVYLRSLTLSLLLFGNEIFLELQ